MLGITVYKDVMSMVIRNLYVQTTLAFDFASACGKKRKKSPLLASTNPPKRSLIL